MLRSRSKWNVFRVAALPLGMLVASGSADWLRADDEADAKPPLVSKEVQDALDALKDAPKKTEGDSQRAEVAASHKQTRSINPRHDGQRVELHTYCLDESGDLWLCVGTADGYVQRYSPEGELQKEIKLDFVPTAINTAPGLDIFVAGNGKMARISRSGEVKTTANLPNLPDPEEFRKQLIEEAKSESATVKTLIEKNITRIEATIEKTEKQIQDLKDKNEEVPKSLDTRLSLYQRQLKSYEARLEKVQVPDVSEADIRQMMASRQRVTALAVTEKDVFVCATGNGYEVWRSTHDFQEPKKVLDRLSGCCGQMDIQASGDQLLVAANTKFQVIIHDRDGNPQSAFGKRDREAVDGFGSCCNPMNIRCCSNGDILCAESSIGNIKRFSPAGELVGFVGKAKIGVGCKHVAIAHDEARDRYYMMNVDKGNIAVMVPATEAPEFTDEELAAKVAMDGLGQKLLGEWAADLPEKKANRTDEEKIRALTRPDFAFQSVKFDKGGKLNVQGGILGMYNGDLSWVPVSQTDNELTISIQMSGADWLEFQVEFPADGEVRVKSQAFGSMKAKRPEAEKKAGA